MNSKVICFSFLIVVAILITFCTKDNNITEGDVNSHLYFEILSGNFQWGIEGEELPDPVTIYITDLEGNPVSNLAINFSIICGGGNLSRSNSYTDSIGQVSVNWTLGNGPEFILKVHITDTDYTSTPIYVYANSNVQIETSWISDVEFTYYDETMRHDNRILESNNFLTFSDAADDDIKIIYNKMAEEAFFHIRELFDVGSSSELGIVSSDINTKLKIYTLSNMIHTQNAVLSGFILYGLDSPTYHSWIDLNPNFWNIFWYKREVTHEMMHTYQYMIGISPSYNVDLWFHEGLGEFSGGGAFPPINNTWELNLWRNNPDYYNPIQVHRIADFPIDYARAGEYYPVYHLAVRYLIDERGLGKTFTAVQNMYRNLSTAWIRFDDAFETHMGISLEYYEEHFFELMTEFLNNTSTTHPAIK